MKAKNSKRRVIVEETINNGKCLLMQIDNRKFFTNKKNLKYLVEAGKKLNASFFIVKIVEAKLIPLSHMHTNINNPNYISPEYQYAISKTLLNGNEILQKNDTNPCIIIEEKTIIPKEKIHIEESKKIRSIIKFALLQGKPISNNELFALLEDFNLSKNKARYYIAYVKKTMEAEGYSFN